MEIIILSLFALAAIGYVLLYIVLPIALAVLVIMILVAILRSACHG